MPRGARFLTRLAVFAAVVAVLAFLLMVGQCPNPVFVAFWLVFAVYVYLVPSINAYDRRHHNLAAIVVLNVLLGWTALGWIIALVWSYTRPAPQVVQP